MSLYAKIYLIYAKTYLNGNASPSWYVRVVKVYAIKCTPFSLSLKVIYDITKVQKCRES